MKLKAAELRASIPDEAEKKALKRNELYIIVDNVLDTYNVGSIFRLADAIAAKKVILCGETETPPNTRIKKASINTTEWVDWEYSVDAKTAIENLKLKIENLRVVAVEQEKRSVPYDTFSYSFPLVLIVGHETHGVSKEVLDLCDTIVELPMSGINTSLNVVVSLGIVLYKAMEYGSHL